VTSEPTVSWREYVDSRFASQKEAVTAALAAADRAVLKAENASEKRFDAVNEFRSALGDNFRTLMPRAEAEQAIRAISEKIDVLTARVNKREDRGGGMGSFAGWIIAAIGAFTAVVSIAFAVMKNS
jgi:homoserine kinase